jgi:hypothetical protein
MTVLYAVTEADFLYLQRECGFTPGNLSSHLSKLENAKYGEVSADDLQSGAQGARSFRRIPAKNKQRVRRNWKWRP